MAIRGSGELKVEFYSHLDEIKDLYFNQGFVVFKILHLKLIEKYHLTLDYQAFCYYARRELKNKKVPEKEENLKESIETEIEQKEKSNEPIIARTEFSKAAPFNPHTFDIDEDRIIK